MDLGYLLRFMDLAQALSLFAVVWLWIRVDKQRVDCIKENKENTQELIRLNNELSFIKGVMSVTTKENEK
jgi:hypothetical protein